jgi:anaerobic magnesium-protoporphyrin IX monomethyl ester cyclase
VRPARIQLAGYEDQDNLGLRYLASRLRLAGHEPRLVAFSEGPEAVLAAVRAFRPDLVGLSLIFQFLAPRFGETVAALRAAGVGTHVTLGGHFASFEPERVLRGLPGVDSIVRFEGEDTVVALAERLVAGAEWRDVPGLAFLDADGTLRLAEPAAARDDLDTLPWPDRADIDYAAERLPTASMLGSRGCPWRCSFCSIVTFYDGNGTQGRRRRDPVRIVDEVEHLHRDRGVEVILWQDDDFLAGGPRATAWAHAVATELRRRGLHHGLRWKISCRSDEVRAATLAPLVEAGLTHVYLGVEAGDAGDLAQLNKLLRPEVHLAAGEVLRELGLSFDFGFMLLNPWSTLASVRGNLDFLRRFVGDGASPAGFCRMLPYAGTPAAERVAAEGRLLVDGFDVDYRFLDPRLDTFFDWTLHALAGHNASGGTWTVLRFLLYEARLDTPRHPRRPGLLEAARELAAEANELLVSVTGQALDVIEAGVDDVRHPELEALRQVHVEEDARLVAAARALLRGRPAVASRMHAAR